MLNSHDMRIAKVKAAIFESRNVERLISKAIRAYRDPRLNEVPKGEVTLYFGNNGEKEILVKNVPMVELEGQTYENLQLTATLEEIIESDSNFSQGKYVIEFEDLLK
ncbi:hypothetical protein [Ureibacillus acetophenoni]